MEMPWDYDLLLAAEHCCPERFEDQQMEHVWTVAVALYEAHQALILECMDEPLRPFPAGHVQEGPEIPF